MAASESIRQKGRAKWIVGFIIIGVLVVLGTIAFFMMNKSEEAKMSSYLRGKYGEEFVVSKAAYKNSGLGVQGIWEAQASPRANSSLKFRVGSYKDQYSDQYVAAIWAQKESPDFIRNVSDVYGNDKPDASLRIVLSGDLAESATKTSPLFNEAKTLERGFLYQAVLLRSHGDEKKITEDALRAAILLDLINKSGVNKRSLDYTIMTDSGDTKHCEISSGDSDLSATVIEKCINKGRV